MQDRAAEPRTWKRRLATKRCAAIEVRTLAALAALGSSYLAACSDGPEAGAADRAVAGFPAMMGGSGAGAVAGSDAAGAGSGAGAPSSGDPTGAGSGGGMPAGGTGGSGGAMAGTGVAGMNAGGAGGAAGMGADGGTEDPGGCTRESLRSAVDSYFTALAANDPSSLSLADDVKFTENGEVMPLGEGLWATAGAVKFKQSAFDTETCGTVTESVVPDGSTDIPFGLRLQLEDQKITEIETIAVREGDYFVASNTGNMLALADDPWETLVPEEQRATREELERWVVKYFKLFPEGGCGFSSDCRRMENGLSLGCTAALSCSDEEPGSGPGVIDPRLILVDVEAGLAVGFVMFLGGYTDFHMMKFAGGEVQGVHAILGEADGSGWD